MSPIAVPGIVAASRRRAAGGGGAPLTYVAAGAKSDGNPVSSVSPALPSGLAANDYMIMCASTYTNVGITTPSGWTQLFYKDSSGSWFIDTYLFGKVAGSSESAPTVARASGTGYVEAQIWAYRGADTASPIDAAAVVTGVTSGTITQPTITTANDNAMVFYTGVAQQPTASWGTPTGETRRFGASPTGNLTFLGLADKTVASHGAVTGQGWVSGTTATSIVIAVSLKPA